MTPRPLVITSVRRRLVLLAGLVVAAFALSAAASYAILVDVQIGGAGYDVLREKAAGMRRLRTLESELQGVRLLIASMISQRDSAQVARLNDELEAATRRVSRDFERTLGAMTELDERVGTRAAQRTWQAFAGTVEEEVVPAVLAGDTLRARTLSSGVQARRAARFSEQLTTSLDVLALRVAHAETSAVVAAGRTWTMTLLAWSMLAALLLVALLWVARSITEPLATLTRAAEGIARGERPGRVEVEGVGEVGALAAAFNEMLALLGETSQRARRSDTLLDSALVSLSRESEEVRASAREQNASLAAIAADLREVAAGASQVAQSTSRVSEAAREAAAASSTGAETVRETDVELTRLQEAVAAADGRVRELGGSTRQVERFADVISDLARETQLLALNAGLEAVKAGEHGKGFALVATRIRELANAVSKEASQVRAVVAHTKDSVQAVEEATREASDAAARGASAAGRLSDSFAGILERVREAEEATQAVESVVQRQVASLRRSSELAGQTDLAVTSNAEALERMAAQVRHLNGVAEDLRALLDRLGGNARE